MEQSSKKNNEMSKEREELVTENNDTKTDQVPTQPREEETSAEQQAQGELKKLQDELAETKDKYLRLYSEFENFRRRTAKEKLEMIQSANEQLIKSLLPVVDDFERAEKSISDISSREEFEGFLLIQQKLKKILDQFGVKPLQLEAGADFDPDTQEAITQIPAPEEKLKGKIIDIVEKGYLLNEKVIRYAKVVVGN